MLCCPAHACKAVGRGRIFNLVDSEHGELVVLRIRHRPTLRVSMMREAGMEGACSLNIFL